MAQKFNQAFCQLGRTEKVQFIEAHLEFASERAIAEYVDTYFLGVARHLPEETIMAMLHYKQEQGKSDETGGN